MNNKNYTMTCIWVGEIKDENLKEVAKVMMWNCCIATYKDDEIIANAGLHMRDDRPHILNVIIDGIHYNYDLTSKRVSAKMGKEIVELILKAVADYKEEKAKEAEDMDIKIVYEDGFEYTDSVESTEPINPEDPWGHTDVDAVSEQANMAYAEHMGWVEDGDDRYEFDSIARADDDKKVLLVNGELFYSK